MARKLEAWVEIDVQSLWEEAASCVAQFHSFRDPVHLTYSDMICFPPVDSIIPYHRTADDVEFIIFGLNQDQAATRGERLSMRRCGSRAAVDILKGKGGEITWNLKSCST